MEFFRIRRDIPFMRYSLFFNLISLITFLLAVFFIATKGLHYSIEFTGGTVIEAKYPTVAPIESIRSELTKLGYPDAQVQTFGTSYDVAIRIPLRKNQLEGTENQKAEFSASQISKIVSLLKQSVPTVEIRNTEVVGSQVGKELAENGLKALIFVVIGVVLYLAFRFEWKFAVAGIIANLHDVVIIIGFFAFFQWEFSLSVLAAVLAILGYSVNESVVIFDRIRETFRTRRDLDTEQTIDHAITSTISRTIITHGSTEIMVLSMLIFGGVSLHYFALALTIGIVFGIYSSVFVAAAIAKWLGIQRSDLVKKEGDGGSELFDKNDPNYGARV